MFIDYGSCVVNQTLLHQCEDSINTKILNHESSAQEQKTLQETEDGIFTTPRRVCC